MTKLTQNDTFNGSTIDLLVGGTPCQSFSVAGLRKGLDDPRGNLMLEFLRIAQAKRPRWLVWENVPGVLSSNGGRDFGAFLTGLGHIGYGWAYRVLDAQYFGVPQRRRRVFVVAYLGDPRPARAVLFERHSLLGHPAPGSTARQATPGGSFTGFGSEHDVTGTLCTGGKSAGSATQQDAENGMLVPMTYRWQNDLTGLIEDDKAATLKKAGHSTDERHVGAFVVNAEGSEGLPFLTRRNGSNGINNQTPLVFAQNQSGEIAEKTVANTVTTAANSSTGRNTTMLCFAQNQREEIRVQNIAGALSAQSGTHQQNFVATVPVMPTLTRGSHNNYPGPNPDSVETLLVQGTADTLTANWHRKGTVRRLTPLECEYLQGFPPHYTLVPGKFLPKRLTATSKWWVKTRTILQTLGVDVSGIEFQERDFGPVYRPRKPKDYAESITYLLQSGFTLQEAQERANCPDGPRYASIGNSMATPVMEWLGERIDAVDKIILTKG